MPPVTQPISRSIGDVGDGSDNMPPQIPPMHAILMLGMMGIAEACSSLLLLASSALAPNAGPNGPLVMLYWHDRAFLAIASLASIMGGVLAIGVLPPDKGESLQKLATKMVCSFILGITFGPALMAWTGIPFVDIYLMLICCFTAMTGVPTVQVIWPYWKALLDRMARKKLGDSENRNSP